MVKKIIIGFLILGGIGIAIFIGYIIMIIAAIGGFDRDYSVSDLKRNFEKKKTEIYDLKSYFNQIVPKNKRVEIEFNNDNNLGRFGISTIDTITGKWNESDFLEWDLDINNQRMDSIIKPLGWNRETFEILKEKLDEANCIGIENGEPTTISFQRSGMGIYSFNVFDKPIPDSLKSTYDDGCTYILVNNKLALEYGGGAIGAQCFYKKE